MRILYIDVNCKNSSTGDIVYNLYKCCEQNGIESSVCYGRGPKIKEKNIFKFGLDFETYLHAFLTRITGYTGCYSYFSTRRLIKYIKRYKPDIVHIHELHAYFVNVKQLLMYLKKNNIPTIFTNHCEFLYTGKCGHAKSCDKYSKNCGHCPLLKEYPKSLLFDHTSHMLKVKRDIFNEWNNIHIVSPSNWIKNKTESSFLCDKPNTVIHNAIDTNVFRFIKKDSTQKVVLSIAPHIFSPNKGGHRIIDIAKQMDDQNIIFILVGADKPFPAAPSNVQIYGYINDKTELAKLYSNADVFLILSENENFPTTSIEAQCCGTKVVGSNVGGISETILENNGIVMSCLDEEKIINAITNIVDSKYDKSTISKISREYYSFNRMFCFYLSIYNEVLKRN